MLTELHQNKITVAKGVWQKVRIKKKPGLTTWLS